jgi:tetratricopeptide (TPR) repeat protein
MRTGLILSLLLCHGVTHAADTPAIGIVLAAGDGSQIRIPPAETAMSAAPGMELRPGYKLSSGAGTIRFAFCPDKTAQTLLPGQTLDIPADHLPKTTGLFGEAQPLPFCELPPSPERPVARTSGTQAPPAASSRGEKVDLLPTIQKARVFEASGDHARAAELYRQIAADYPHAAWTRGILLQNADQSRPVEPGSQGKTVALLIGISKYPKEAPFGDLQFAAEDARAFAAFLKTEKGGKLPDSQIKLLLDGDATRDHIDSAVSTFVQPAAAKQNTLILLVASHGHFLHTETDPETNQVIESDPYIVTADAYRQDLKTTGYPMNEFRRMIAEQTRVFGRVIVYVDVCHAGYVANTAGEEGLAPAVKRVFVSRLGNVGIMMASDTKFAYEAPEFGGHGAFTYYVLHGLYGGAARPNASVMTFADLYQHVSAGVGRLTNNGQNPDRFVIDDQMAVLDHVNPDRTIPLPEATPLPEAATRRRRGSPLLPNEPAQPPTTAASTFDALARKDPLAAAAEYARSSATPQQAEALRVSLEEHGQKILIQYLRGEQVRQSKSDFELGARYFEEALKLAPLSTYDESRLLFCQGRALVFEEGQLDDSHYAAATPLLERSILLDPTRAYAYNALGIAYLQQVRKHAGYYDRAVAAFHDAMRFAPDWAYPVHNLALALFERGQFAAAAREYAAAMKLAPQYSYLPYNFAVLNQRLNRLDEAEKLYQLALTTADQARRDGIVPEVKPWRERNEILNALGTVAAAHHRTKDARQFYEKAIQDDPQFAAAKYNLAVLLSRRGPSSDAEKLWRENLAADPKSAASRLALAAYLAKYAGTPAAIQEYELALAVVPENSGARRELARLYERDNRWDAALEQLRQALSRSPNEPRTLEELGDAAAHLGHNDDAAKAYADAANGYEARNDRKRVTQKRLRLGAPK